MAFNNSYMITNRATSFSLFGDLEFSDTNPTPIDPTGSSGAMFFLMSSNPYDQNYANYKFTNAPSGLVPGAPGSRPLFGR
jgi:hypothetical protein